MADVKILDQISNNEPARAIAGGLRRVSKRVDLERFELIRRRQELNAQLLERGCAFDDRPMVEVRPADLGLLLQIAREHDPNANPIVRKEAVLALGQLKSLEAAEALWQIASSETEHESLRGQALVSLVHVAPSMAPTLLQTQLHAKSPLVRQSAVNAIAEMGDRAGLEVLAALLKREKDRGVRQRATAAIHTLRTHLGLRAGRPAVRKRLKRAHRPGRE